MAGSSKKHIYILPENFQGVVVIFYGQKNGNTVEYDKDGNIVFRISKNGILKTQLDFAPNALEENEFYYTDRTQLTYKEEVGLLNDSISALGLHYGKLYKELNGKPIMFEMLYVANKNNIDSIARIGEDMKLLQFVE